MSTIKQQLLKATAKLAEDSSTARLDAEVLLSHILNQPRCFLYSHGDDELDYYELHHYADLISKRAEGEPIAYLIGEKDFWDFTLKVTPDVLIPRPETEHLVEFALSQLPITQKISLAELGTGSGAIAIALARERPTWDITATDVCPQALKIAQQNAAVLQATHVHFCQRSWFEAIAQQRFHAIVSNPPYVAAHDAHLNEGDVRFEPPSALVAGLDGLTAIRAIISQALDHLHPGGLLMLEHGFDQADSVHQLLTQNHFHSIASHQDLAGHLRFTSAHS